MPEFLHSHYDTLKDFAGPAATAFAALVATLITGSFAIAQYRLARAQKDIALDKLKHDLFERRYKIYSAAKETIEYITTHRDTDKIDTTKIRDLRITIDEARFFFDRETREFLERLVALSEDYYSTLYRRDHISIDDPQWGAVGGQLATYINEFRKLYADLPKAFEPALRFSQLQK